MNTFIDNFTKNFGIFSGIYLIILYLKPRSSNLSFLTTHDTKNGPIDIYESKDPSDCYYDIGNNIIVTNKKYYNNNFALNHELQHFYDRKLEALNDIVHVTTFFTLIEQNFYRLLPLVLLSYHRFLMLFEKRADKHACEVLSPEDLIDGFKFMKKFESISINRYRNSTSFGKYQFILEHLLFDVHPSYKWRLKLISDTYKYKTGIDLSNVDFY